MRVLVTGGLGFIGSRLVKHLLQTHNDVCINILDNHSPQIHGVKVNLPDFLNDSRVQVYFGSVDDMEILARAFSECNRVVHLAAETGTGQSMYSIQKYTHTNLNGTTNLIDLIASTKGQVDRVVVASSRAIYGEGKYHCNDHGHVYPRGRAMADLKLGQFEPRCPICNEIASVLPTDESSTKNSSSYYALTKQFQEESLILFSNAYSYQAVALRYQNVFGPGQSLGNPYTGLLAVFSNLARAGQDITIFEDGNETRDFVHVDDVVRATALALMSNNLAHHSYNVGSGIGTSVLDVANQVVKYFSSKSNIIVSGAFRIGDIRHNLADLSRIKSDLGFAPHISFNEGLVTFLDWAGRSNPGSTDYFRKSLEELRGKGLYHEKN